jgi:hypothetical protein
VAGEPSMNPDLEDLYDELQRGKVYECALRDRLWHLDGLQSGDAIYIDPRSAVLESVIHELIHRRKPRLGERTVTRLARQMIASMDEATKRTWWNRYNRIKRKTRPVEIDE